MLAITRTINQSIIINNTSVLTFTKSENNVVTFMLTQGKMSTQTINMYVGQTFKMGNNVKVTVVKLTPHQVKVEIRAPRHILINREEVQYAEAHQS